MDSDIDILRCISIMSMTKYGYPTFIIISDSSYQKDIDNLPTYIKHQLDLTNNYYLYLSNPPYGLNKILIKITKESVKYTGIITDTINYIVDLINQQQKKYDFYNLNQNNNRIDIYIININKEIYENLVRNKRVSDFMSLVFTHKNIIISEEDLFDYQPDEIIIFSSRFSIN